jgi:hypothetical protein
MACRVCLNPERLVVVYDGVIGQAVCHEGDDLPVGCEIVYE